MRFRKRAETGADVVSEVDPVVVEILAAPVHGEGVALEAVRKAGGDERVEKAAAAAARALDALREAFGGELPDDVAKAVRDQLRGAPTKLRPIARMGEDDLLEHEADDGEDGDGVSDADEVLKAESTPGAGWIEVAKIEREASDALSERTLEIRVASLRREHPNMTREQAVAKALDDDPSLYTSLRRVALRKQGVDVDPIGYEPPALDRGLEVAAAEIRKANPELTEAQSVAKALEDNPALYERSTQ